MARKPSLVLPPVASLMLTTFSPASSMWQAHGLVTIEDNLDNVLIE